ncbi:hypothetical protein TDB9533_00462 [Thalassocella blandensis]|nr:hypothetical protein TDB9533_00462 [Thalassocella blandensis]
MSPSNQKIENKTLVFLLSASTLAFLWILTPFFGPLFWALAIAIIFYPLHVHILNRYPGRHNSAAALTLLACIMIIVLPITITTLMVAGEIMDFYEKIEDGDINLDQRLARLDQGFSSIESWAQGFGIDLGNLKERLSSGLTAGGKFFAQHTFKAGINIFQFLLGVGVMLYMAFFMIRDGKKLTKTLVKCLPLRDDREYLLFSKIAEVIRATVKGNLIVAIIQGSLGGLIFWVLGLPGALIWGVVMVAASLIPAIGAGIVWGPVAIYLLFSGDVWQGVVLIAWGGLVIGLVDNLLRPVLVGRDTKLPDYLVLISTLGGIALMGVNGFITGPIIAAMFVAVWGIFSKDMADDEQEDRRLQQKS